VAHSLPWWRGDTSNETYNWFVARVMFCEPFRCVFFSLSANFTYHDDSFCLWITYESIKNVNKTDAMEWISANANHR
jgi:hypothetical protein